MSTILQQFSYADFQKYHAQWLTHGRMVWFICGNMNMKASIDLVEKARKCLSMKAIPRDRLLGCRSVIIPEGQSHRIDFPLLDKTNGNSVLISHF